MNGALWVLIIMVGVSLFRTFDLVLSLDKVAGMILGVLLFWAIVRWITTDDRLRLATVAFLGCGVLLSALGLLGTNWDNKFAPIGAITAHLPAAIRGVRGAERGFSTNAVAGCLVLFVPLQLGLITTGGRWLFPNQPSSRPLVVICEGVLLLVTAGTLILTESRTSWIGLMVGGVAFLMWYQRWTQWLVGVGLTGLLATTALVGSDAVSDFVISRAGPAFVSTWDLRAKLWPIAIAGIGDYGFAGAGMNTFRKIMPTRYPGYPALPGEEVAHVHNHLLQAALDVGLIGLVAYLAIWILCGVLLVFVYRRASERWHRVAAGGLGVGLIAHFMFGLADVIPLGSKVGVLFWLTLALTVSFHHIALTFTRSSGRDSYE